jgi:hypothetical protein
MSSRCPNRANGQRNSAHSNSTEAWSPGKLRAELSLMPQAVSHAGNKSPSLTAPGTTSDGPLCCQCNSRTRKANGPTRISKSKASAARKTNKARRTCAAEKIQPLLTMQANINTAASASASRVLAIAQNFAAKGCVASDAFNP